LLGEVQVVNQNPTTTNDNIQIPPSIERHIMISYNRESSSDICTNIYDRLKVNISEFMCNNMYIYGILLLDRGIRSLDG
jgi:hypothetical protein